MAQAQTFKVGDVVQLKSGGPKMTISEIQSNGNAWCQWFINNEPKGGSFKQEVLTLA